MSRFALLGLFHQAHDAGQRRLVAGGRHPHPQAAVAVDGPGDDLVARLFEHRLGLAGDHGLVDLRLALLHLAVGRDAGAGPHQHQVTLAAVR